MSQKFVPPISCAIILIKTLIISTWSFKEMFIALSSTRVQNVSYRYAPFDCLFITFFKDVTAWSEISHVAWRPQMIHSRFFVFTWYAVATSIPNNIFFQVRQLEKNILGIHSKKKILSALRLLYFFTCKFDTSWALLGWLSRTCFSHLRGLQPSFFMNPFRT